MQFFVQLQLTVENDSICLSYFVFIFLFPSPNAGCIQFYTCIVYLFLLLWFNGTAVVHRTHNVHEYEFGVHGKLVRRTASKSKSVEGAQCIALHTHEWDTKCIALYFLFPLNFANLMYYENVAYRYICYVCIVHIYRLDGCITLLHYDFFSISFLPLRTLLNQLSVSRVRVLH